MENTTSARNIPASELAVGMEVWIPAAWSSNGMKAGSWNRIETIRTEERFWIGTMIETNVGGFAALASDGETNMVTVR